VVLPVWMPLGAIGSTVVMGLFPSGVEVEAAVRRQGADERG
jgi:hypothetical protein